MCLKLNKLLHVLIKKQSKIIEFMCKIILHSMCVEIKSLSFMSALIL